MSVRERSMNLLLKAVTYMVTMERATCVITIEIVICIRHCRKYHLHDCNRESYLHNFNKNSPTYLLQTFALAFAAGICTGIIVAKTSNYIIATETVTFITATKRSTNISVTESTTNIIAIEHQNLYNCSRHLAPA